MSIAVEKSCISVIINIRWVAILAIQSARESRHRFLVKTFQPQPYYSLGRSLAVHQLSIKGVKPITQLKLNKNLR